MAIITLVRKTLSIPDDGLKLYIVYEDQGNPLKDSDGNIQYTDKLDDTGQIIPEYPEYVVSVALPELPDGLGLPSEATVTSLLIAALELAKTQAADNVAKAELRDAYKSVLKSVDPSTAAVYQESA